jgi:hypothetical protein
LSGIVAVAETVRSYKHNRAKKFAYWQFSATIGFL